MTETTITETKIHYDVYNRVGDYIDSFKTYELAKDIADEIHGTIKAVADVNISLTSNNVSKPLTDKDKLEIQVNAISSAYKKIQDELNK